MSENDRNWYRVMFTMRGRTLDQVATDYADLGSELLSRGVPVAPGGTRGNKNMHVFEIWCEPRDEREATWLLLRASNYLVQTFSEAEKEMMTRF